MTNGTGGLAAIVNSAAGSAMGSACLRQSRPRRRTQAQAWQRWTISVRRWRRISGAFALHAHDKLLHALQPITHATRCCAADGFDAGPSVSF